MPESLILRDKRGLCHHINLETSKGTKTFNSHIFHQNNLKIILQTKVDLSYFSCLTDDTEKENIPPVSQEPQDNAQNDCPNDQQTKQGDSCKGRVISL